MSGRKVYTQQEADDRVRRALYAERERNRLVLPRLEREEPHRFRASTMLLSIPGVWERFKPVPDEFYKREGATAVIECPCGWAADDDPTRRQQRIEFGELVECPGCERFYFNGKRLHAARSDEPEAQAA